MRAFTLISLIFLSSLLFKSVCADQTQDAPQNRQLIQESGATGLSDRARQGRLSLGGALGFYLGPRYGSTGFQRELLCKPQFRPWDLCFNWAFLATESF